MFKLMSSNSFHILSKTEKSSRSETMNQSKIQTIMSGLIWIVRNFPSAGFSVVLCTQLTLSLEVFMWQRRWRDGWWRTEGSDKCVGDESRSFSCINVVSALRRFSATNQTSPSFLCFVNVQTETFSTETLILFLLCFEQIILSNTNPKLCWVAWIWFAVASVHRWTFMTMCHTTV